MALNKELLAFIANLMMNEYSIKDMYRDIYSELDRMGVEFPEELDHLDHWKFLAVTYDVLPDYLDEEDVAEFKLELEERHANS